MYTTNIKKIMKEKLMKEKLMKEKLILKIKKSIYHNNNIRNNLKIYVKYINNKKKSFLTKQNNFCIFSGKKKTILKGFSFSRYFIKNLILKNNLTNIKKNNW